MKNTRFLNIFIVVFLLTALSCTSNSNDPEFLSKVEGRYLYTADEVVKVHSKDNKLLINWRGANEIAPSKLNEDTFYVKEMNAKIQFLTNPDDQNLYLVFLPKDAKDSIEFIHKKLENSEKTPNEYLENHEFEKALEGYLSIKAKDSMSPLLDFWYFDRRGRKYLENDSLDIAMKIFKMNAKIHPNTSDAYVRLGRTYLNSKDTVNALTNYKKALKFNSGSRRLKERIAKLENKEAEKSN